MDNVSEAILALRPVTFRYKKDIDPERTPQFGLIAEEVSKVNSDLITRDTEGKPLTVSYDAINAMLLNEFIKEHRTVQELKSIVAKQEASIAQLTATVARQQQDFAARLKLQDQKIQKVSDRIGLDRPEPKMIDNR